jgi:hypothetical protein
MVLVIGTSFTVENAVKGVYEETVGRVFEGIASGSNTAEDRYGAAMAQRYVDFIRVRPWYEYSFLSELKGLWREPWWGAHPLRKWERRAILSTEYLVKAQYASVITAGTRAAYGTADTEILVVADGVPEDLLARADQVRMVARLGDGGTVLGLPRYDAFRDAAGKLAAAGAHFRALAGNHEILMTCVVPKSWTLALSSGQVVLSQPILTNPALKRVGVLVQVPALHEVLGEFARRQMPVEHLYDY